MLAFAFVRGSQSTSEQRGQFLLKNKILKVTWEGKQDVKCSQSSDALMYLNLQLYPLVVATNHFCLDSTLLAVVSKDFLTMIIIAMLNEYAAVFNKVSVCLLLESIFHLTIPL